MLLKIDAKESMTPKIMLSQRSMKIMAQADKAHSTSTRINPSLSDFCYPNVLKTCQQPTPKLGNLKWMNNNCKSNGQKLWEFQDGCLAFPGSLVNLVFYLMGYTCPGCRVNALTMEKISFTKY